MQFLDFGSVLVFMVVVIILASIILSMAKAIIFAPLLRKYIEYLEFVRKGETKKAKQPEPSK